MNGTSGFGEVRRFSISRLPINRFLVGQRRQFGTGFWCLLRAHDPITLSLGISTNEKRFMTLYPFPIDTFMTIEGMEKK